MARKLNNNRSDQCRNSSFIFSSNLAVEIRNERGGKKKCKYFYSVIFIYKVKELSNHQNDHTAFYVLCLNVCSNSSGEENPLLKLPNSNIKHPTKFGTWYDVSDVPKNISTKRLESLKNEHSVLF